eukprot:5615743-Pyramimonas_sp.AAC.1
MPGRAAADTRPHGSAPREASARKRPLSAGIAAQRPGPRGCGYGCVLFAREVCRGRRGGGG